MSFSIRLTKEEKMLAESYAKLHSVSLGEAFKNALFEKIEDEYDIAIAEEAYKEYLENPKTYSIDEAEEILNK
ncbi:MAG: DUF6290 family protein [Clostridia bacterium]|nr:DUF6290 family protein [Clostridia bacterium]